MARRYRTRKSNTTHIICILDRSGSMSGMQDEVISNFNHFLAEQKELEGKAKLTLVLFDDRYEMIYDEIDLQKARRLTNRQYFARGMTAMNDAVGRTLVNKKQHDKAIVLIHTDGYENHSKEYTPKDIKKLVKGLKKKWEFIFVGADIDAQRTNRDYGFTHTLQSHNDNFGMNNSYELFNTVTACYRSSGGAVGSSATMNMVAEANSAEESDISPILNLAGNNITTTTISGDVDDPMLIVELKK